MLDFVTNTYLEKPEMWKDYIIPFIAPFFASLAGSGVIVWFGFKQFKNQQKEERERWINDAYAREQARILIDLRNKYYNWSNSILPLFTKLLMHKKFTKNPNELAEAKKEEISELLNFIQTNRSIIINKFNEDFYNRFFLTLDNVYYFLDEILVDLSFSKTNKGTSIYEILEKSQIIESFYKLLNLLQLEIPKHDEDKNDIRIINAYRRTLEEEILRFNDELTEKIVVKDEGY